MRKEYIHNPSLEYDLDLYYCGREDCEPDFSCGPNVRDCYLIHFVTKGSGFYRSGEKTWELRPGQLFTIFPNDVVYYWTEEEDPWSFCWFSFNGKRASELLNRAGLHRSAPLLDIPGDGDIPLLVEQMGELLEAKPRGYEIRVQGCLYTLLANLALFADGTEQANRSSDRSAAYIEGCLKFIEFNYHRNLSVSEVVAYINLERTYFSKLFKKHCGISPQDYITRYKVEKACRLMEDQALSISDVARCVGYEQVYYFSRMFKKVTGMRPSDYLRIVNTAPDRPL